MKSSSTDLWLGYVTRIWAQFAYFGFFIVAGRILSPEAFGVYALSALFVLLGQSFMYVGPYHYIVAARTMDGARGATFTLQITLATFAVAVLVGLSYFADDMFRAEGVSELIIATAPILWLAATCAWMEAMILRQKRLSRYYITTFGTETAGIIAGVAALIWGMGVYSLVIYRYVGTILTAIAFLSASVRLPRPTWEMKKMKEVMKFGSGLYGNVVADHAANYAADLFIGLYLNPAAVAHYRMGNRMVNAITDIAGQPARNLGWSMMSAVERDTGDLASVWPRFFSLFFLVVGSALVGLALLAPDLIALVLGPSWAPTADVVVILCAVRAFSSFAFVTIPVFGAKDRNGLAFKLRMVELTLLLVGILYFSRLGLSEAAIGQAPAAIFSAFAAWFALKHITGAKKAAIPSTFAVPVGIILLTAASVFAARALGQSMTANSAIILVLATVVGGIVWIAATRLLAWNRLIKPIVAVWRETPA